MRMFCACVVALLAGCVASGVQERPFLPMLPPPESGQDEIFLTAAFGGVLKVDQGCIKVVSPNGHSTRTVLWHHGTELGRDASGMFLRNAKTGTVYRFGTRIEFGGGEMPDQWVRQRFPNVAQRCAGPYASAWLPG